MPLSTDVGGERGMMLYIRFERYGEVEQKRYAVCRDCRCCVETRTHIGGTKTVTVAVTLNRATRGRRHGDGGDSEREP